MPIVQLKQNGFEPVTKTMATPKRVGSMEHWLKTACKALNIPVPIGTPSVMQADVKRITWQFPADGLRIEIDRTKDQMGQPKRY
jgi:hypothetical protein